MKQYIDIVKKILDNGEFKDNRTGIKAKTISGAIFEHDMNNGFPLLTTKFVSLKNVAIELEFFIKGLRDKRWLQERGCHIWDEWSNPESNDKNDLGRIYGVQWREWFPMIDQLKNVVKTLKNNPNDRRMIVSAWKPDELSRMALPPCHLLWHVVIINDKLNLNWYQRSVDTMLGLPYNIASYGLLLKLLCKESGFKEGKLCGMLGDVHIYENHIENAILQINREPNKLSNVEITNFKSIFDWTYEQFKLENYEYYPTIKFNVAI